MLSRGQAGFFLYPKNETETLYASLPLAFCQPKRSLMTVLSCKGGWDM